MKFRILSAVAAAALLSAPLSLAAGIGVAVIRTDGTTHHVEIADINRIDVGADKVTVHSHSGGSTEHSIADIDRIDIGVSTSGIADIVADGSVAVWPTMAESTINIAGVPAGTTVKVFDIQGVAHISAVTAQGTMSLDVSKLASGAYIVAVGDKSVKIVKR